MENTDLTLKQEDISIDAVSYTHLDVYKRQDLDEAGFASYLGGKEKWWIGLSKEKQGSFTIPYYVLGQDRCV